MSARRTSNGGYETPAAFSDAAGVFDLSDMLTDVAGDTYAYARDRFVQFAPVGAEVVPCQALLDPQCFAGIIDRYAARYPDADRRAVVSMWSLYYFSVLTIGAAIYWLELQRILPLALEDVSLCLDPASGEPRALVLGNPGRVDPDATAFEAMQPMLRAHAEPLIAGLAAHAGVAKKLLWSNAAGYLGWIIRDIGARRNPGATPDAIELIEAPIWPDGWKNPFFGAIRQQCDENGEQFGRRRVCCLRYSLPGVPGCGRVCPLPEGRA